MLNLHKLIRNIRAIRNLHVLGLNEKPVSGGKSFADTFGWLCGDNEEILIEESLEMLFKESAIAIEDLTEHGMILSQNGVKYKIEITCGHNKAPYPNFRCIKKEGV